MNSEQQMKDVKGLLKAGEYDLAEELLLSLISEAEIKQVIDNTNTHFCCKNYIELMLVNKYYQIDKENICPDVNYPEIYFNLAYINLEKANYGLAMEYIKMGLKWNPADVSLMFYLAKVYKIMNNMEDYITVLQLVYNYIYESSYLALYYRELGWYYLEVGATDIAKALYTHSIKFEESDEAVNALIYIAKLNNEKPKTMSPKTVTALLKEVQIGAGFNETVLTTVANEYIDWKETSTKSNNFKFTSRVLYDMTKNKKYMLYTTIKDEDRKISVTIPETWAYIRKAKFERLGIPEDVVFMLKNNLGEEISVTEMGKFEPKQLEDNVNYMVNALKEKGYKIHTVDKTIDDRERMQVVFDIPLESGMIARVVDTYINVNGMLLSIKWNVSSDIKGIYSSESYSWIMDVIKSIKEI